MTVYWSDLEIRLEGIGRRLDNIETYLAAVSAQLGAPFTTPSAGLPPEVVELVRAGKRVEAATKYRQLTNASLEDTRRAIAAI
ncbi:MAG TPA: hypothetical protein VI462_10590 [Acidimicrobiia bacterium]